MILSNYLLVDLFTLHPMNHLPAFISAAVFLDRIFTMEWVLFCSDCSDPGDAEGEGDDPYSVSVGRREGDAPNPGYDVADKPPNRASRLGVGNLNVGLV